MDKSHVDAKINLIFFFIQRSITFTVPKILFETHSLGFEIVSEVLI